MDKYPWTGHSAILGKRKNPLIPEVGNLKSGIRNQRTPNKPGKPDSVKGSTPSPSAEGGLVGHPCGGFSFSLSSGKGKKQHDPDHPVNPVKKKPLAEKTIEDVLLHFGDTIKVARRRYRQFIKKGSDHGTRPELQGGGLVRSAGGNKVGLLGRKKDEREKGDERILGSGDFISNIVQESDNKLQKRTISHPSLKNLIGETAHHFDVSLQALVSRSRNRQVSKARAVISYLAVNEVGYTQEEVSNHLNISL